VTATLRLLVYALALFVNGMLLASILPIVGKLVLPRLGGTPEVWTACAHVFGIATLVGYGYALLATRRSWLREMSAVHLVLVALPLALSLFRIGGPESLHNGAIELAPNANPAVAVVLLLGPAVAPIHLVLVANTLLLPRWFAETDGPGADDPYFLHAATGLGSLAGLLGYQFLVEPHFIMVTQTRWWTVGYGVMACLVLTCAILARQGRRTTEMPSALGNPTLVRCVRWMAWTALAVTLQFSALRRFTSYTPLPASYFVPLALYSLASAAAFGRIAAKLPSPTNRLAQILGTLVLVGIVFAVLVPGLSLPITVAVAIASGLLLWVPGWLALALLLPAILLHLALAASLVEMSPLVLGGCMVVLYFGLLVCFGGVARGRPSPQYLVEFFACLLVGEWLGQLLQLSLAHLGAYQETVEYAMVVGFALSRSRKS
jgi:hypothetical protein